MADSQPGTPTPDEPASGAGTGDWGSGARPGGWQPSPIAAGPTPGVAYADLVPRVVAYIIDALILGIGYGVVWSVVLTALFVTGGFGGVLIGAILGGVLLLVASAVYFIYTWTSMRASPGQKMLGLETVNAADGATLTQNQAITRWLYLFGPSILSAIFSWSAAAEVGFLSSLVSLAVLAYYIYLLYTAANDPKRQAFHDKQSGTVVVKRTA